MPASKWYSLHVGHPKLCFDRSNCAILDKVRVEAIWWNNCGAISIDFEMMPTDRWQSIQLEHPELYFQRSRPCKREKTRVKISLDVCAGGCLWISNHSYSGGQTLRTSVSDNFPASKCMVICVDVLSGRFLDVWCSKWYILNIPVLIFLMF